ncbi:MAG: hypothetical protein ACJ8D4_08495, partial [Xanthobacteraceae bacterium]
MLWLRVAQWDIVRALHPGRVVDLPAFTDLNALIAAFRRRGNPTNRHRGQCSGSTWHETVISF